jgi:predicted GIY-YIG superfamily endonuclease
MTLVCPICNSVAQELDRTGDASGFYCATHSAFKVADAVFAEHRAKDYTAPQWEAALKKAKRRTKQGEWPLHKQQRFLICEQLAPK